MTANHSYVVKHSYQAGILVVFVSSLSRKTKTVTETLTGVSAKNFLERPTYSSIRVIGYNSLLNVIHDTAMIVFQMLLDINICFTGGYQMDLITVLIILFVAVPILVALSISLTTILNVLGWVCLAWGCLMALASDTTNQGKRWLVFILHGIVALILFAIANSCEGQRIYDLIF